MRNRTEPTTEEKRVLMKMDRLLSLNGMDKEQLLGLARVLASTLMDTVPDDLVENDWDYLYADLWEEGMADIHED